MIFVTVSTGHFDPLIEECDRLAANEVFYGQIGSGYFTPRFQFSRAMLPEDLDRKMQEAELVVSHGGTGMLSRLYQLKKRAIVVPKQIRYGEANNSQVELAVKWAELGCAILCMDVKELEKKIEECRAKEFSFPAFPSLGKALVKQLKFNEVTKASSRVLSGF